MKFPTKFFAVVALLVASVTQVQAATVGEAMVNTAGWLEWGLYRIDVCEKRLAALQAQLQSLQAYPVKNAATITDVKARIADNQVCIKEATARTERRTTRLAELQRDFSALTEKSLSSVKQQVDALRADHKWRVPLEWKIRELEAQIARLSTDPVKNAGAISAKQSELASTRVALEAVMAEVESSGGALLKIESDALALAATSARLSWTIPTTRENGTALAAGDIGGYEIYMLSDSTGKSTVFTVNDPLAVSYKIAQLTPDTYYFSIAAFDSEGQMSEMSDVVSKTIL